MKHVWTVWHGVEYEGNSLLSVVDSEEKAFKKVQDHYSMWYPGAALTLTLQWEKDGDWQRAEVCYPEDGEQSPNYFVIDKREVE